MHFSIPETVEHTEQKGIYTTYEVNLNGVHHCSVRYRQLYVLHENLRKEFQPYTLPTFPPKKLLPLTIAQVEERRLLLEKYLQLLSQDPRVISSLSFNGFLLGAQQETNQESLVETNLDVFLMNEHKIVVRGLTIMQTEEVLERVCQQLGVPEELAVHLSLYLVRREGHHSMFIVRKLQHFEAPYISVKNDRSSKLVLRKCSWDPSIDDLLLENPVTLNLLYIQTVSDVEMKWIQVPQETEKLLARMQARGAKYEYMETARGLTDFGYVHFLPCFCDYPRPHTNSQVLIGQRELVLRVVGTDGEVKEWRFRVTKMRCWKIMTLSPSQGKISEVADDPNPKLELSFEYLMANDEMQWITIISSQAIIMSLSLQSIVEEMLRLKSGIKQRMLGEKTSTVNFSFRKADGTEVKVPVRSATNELKMELASLTKRTTASQSHPLKLGSRTLMDRQYSVKKLSEKFSVINMRTASRAAENVFIENEAFQELKDEDL